MILCRQLLLLVFVLVTGLAKAQDKHFIYIQSENKQPFYVQVNNQTYSSTATGYVIISQLMKGKYYLVAGFAKNSFPEQKFIVDIADKDAGFSLKQFGDKKWGLFDLVYFNTIMADNEEAAPAKEIAVAPVVKDTVALVQPVSKDTVTITAVTEKPVVVIDSIVAIAAAPKPLPVTDSIVTIGAVAEKPATDTITIIAPAKEKVVEAPAVNQPTPVTVVAAPVIAAAVNKTSPVAKNKISKTFERVAAKGIDQIYVDNTNRKKADTIAILIPLIIDTLKAKKIVPVKPVVAPVTVIKTAPVKRCAAVATNDDFYRVRLDMAAATTDDAMILAGKKFFKMKCYSTDQIKNLGFLFLAEGSRFRFFESAKPFISDAENYPSLQLQFTQAEWIEKFRASAKTN